MHLLCKPPFETPARSLLNDGSGELVRFGRLLRLGRDLGVLGVGEGVVLEAAQLVVIAAVAFDHLLMLQCLVSVTGNRCLQWKIIYPK